MMHGHQPCDHTGNHDSGHRHDAATAAREALAGPQIEPIRLKGKENVADLIDDAYGKSGFNARRLAEACQLYSHMLRDDTTVAVTLSGAMTPIGMGGVLGSLIEAGFVDFII